MKTLKNPWFYTPLGIAILVYILPRLGVKLPNIITFYLNDLLCMPIVLTLCLTTIRVLYGHSLFFLSIRMIVAMTVFYIVLFEGILPLSMQRYTTDIIDIFLYFIGAFIFYKIQPKLKDD